jgi:hypothetical protein
MAASLRDAWGEAALRQPGGPSYAFFANLLPPLRYVNTDFRHYPVVLSAPAAAVKARWVSNGSAVNARANQKPMWREVGFPVAFRVGAGEGFGADVTRLDGPRYRAGYLPVVQVGYTHGQIVYQQEAFAPVRAPWAERGAVFLLFTARKAPGVIRAAVDRDSAQDAASGAVRDSNGQALVLFGDDWRWDGRARELRADLAAGGSALLAVLTRPLPPPFPALTAKRHDAELAACVARWEALLQRGMRLEVPEPLVQDAWRALVVGNFLIAVGDRMHYSAGNAYDHLYEAECGDAVRALMLFGFTGEARRMIGPLLDFQRKATRFHVAGHKLQLLSHYYHVTRDAAYLKEKERVWKGVADFIVGSRQAANGLLPRDNYAGDISRQVVALNSNANCWRGLRDLAAILAESGYPELARQYARQAKEFRTAILAAVAKSEDRDARFIPNALFGEEKSHNPITATRLGSYYNLMAPYIIGSGVFAPGSQREGWMVEYPRRHGGLAMGMIRSTPHQGQFKGEPGVNVLYGLRYVLAQLRCDEPGRALAGFYGQLAQGMTRGTFIGGEGSRFLHGDRHGRSFYLPPNSTSNAMFLTTLRYLLVQDWDLDDDGTPETLRLLYGAPGRWLKDGAVLRLENAPSAFGPVSLLAESRLGHGEVRVTVTAPPRRPARWLLRLPLPEGWRVAGARVEGRALPLGREGAVDLTGRTGRFTIQFRVARRSP